MNTLLVSLFSVLVLAGCVTKKSETTTIQPAPAVVQPVPVVHTPDTVIIAP